MYLAFRSSHNFRYDCKKDEMLSSLILAGYSAYKYCYTFSTYIRLWFS